MMTSEAEHSRCGGRFRLRFGAAVEGSDGRIGTLHQVLLEPATRRVSGLVIRTGLFLPRELRVAWGTILSATEAEVRLSLSADEARGLREKQARRSREQPSGAAGRGAKRAPIAVSDALQVTVADGRGAGRVCQLLAMAASGEIVELVVESGLFTRQSRRLPGEWVRQYTGTAVEVDATPGSMAGLPSYRGDQQLRADILDAWFYDDRLRSILLRAPLEVKVCEGVAWVEGYTPSRESRDRFKGRARSVPGVMAVDGAIVTDEELTHAVMAALVNDPRTRKLRPRVESSLGFISLEGEAPAQAVREAASEVVASVPRVRGVLNRLRVEGTGGPPAPERLLIPRIAQWVYTRDGRCGQVDRVLLSARDRLVAGIVVTGQLPVPGGAPRTGFSQDWPRRERNVVVPADWILAATSAISLRVGLAEVAALPDYWEGEYPAPDPGWIPPYPYQRGEVRLVRPSGVQSSARYGGSREPAGRSPAALPPLPAVRKAA